jgi:hypothetical protein
MRTRYSSLFEVGIWDCIYDHVKKWGIGKTLRMGEACRYCRLAKNNTEIP